MIIDSAIYLTQFALIGGSTRRMRKVADSLAEEFHLSDDEKKQIDMSRTDRFLIYKVGPILSISVSNYNS